MSNLYSTGIRGAIDAYLAEQQAKVRDYGEYFSASSAGYCMRKLIFERLGVPPVAKDSDARKTRVFEAGHVFHAWVQAITKNAGLSIAQELELSDETLMVRGHIDDLVLVDGKLILMDYKTQNSRAFTWQKDREVSYYHKMQVGTYMYMLRTIKSPVWDERTTVKDLDTKELAEARILKMDKDNLRMDEDQVLWSPELELEVIDYWLKLNEWWASRKLPPCSCAEHEGGFMAKEAFNPYFYKGQPCSIELYQEWKAK